MPVIKPVIEQRFPVTNPTTLIDAAREQLSQQFAFVDAIEAKLGVYLGVQSALIGLLVAVLVVQTKTPHLWGLLGIVESAAIYAASVGIAAYGLWAREWKGPDIDIRRLYADQFDLPQKNAAGWKLAKSYTLAYEKNEPAYKAKALMIRLAPIGLVAQTVLLVVTLLEIRLGL